MAFSCDLSSQTNTTIPRFGSQGTVNVKVGADKRCFTIHKDLLRQSSPYFKSALDGGFKESHENVIILPDDNPDVFELYVRWLYLQRLDLESQDVQDLVSSQNLVQLYVFAEMRGISPLKNIVMNLIIQRCEKPLADAGRQILREIPYVYENTPEKSPLRRLLVDLVVVEDFILATLNKVKESLTTEFLMDLAGRLEVLTKDRAYDGLNHLPPCFYHEHKTRNSGKSGASSEEGVWKLARSRIDAAKSGGCHIR